MTFTAAGPGMTVTADAVIVIQGGRMDGLPPESRASVTANGQTGAGIRGLMNGAFPRGLMIS